MSNCRSEHSSLCHVKSKNAQFCIPMYEQMNKSCHTYERCISRAVDTILCQGRCNPCLRSTHQPSRSVATQYWQEPVTHNCTELHGRRREHYLPSSWPTSTYFQEEIISAGLSLFMCIFVSCYVQNSWV